MPEPYSPQSVVVTQLAGPGAERMSDDVPLYHFDLNGEQLAQMLSDPDAYLEALGLVSAEARGVRNLNIVLPRSGGRAKLAEDDAGTGARTGPPDGGTPVQSCVYIQGTEDDQVMVVHRHTTHP